MYSREPFVVIAPTARAAAAAAAPPNELLRCTDPLESTGGFSLGGFSSLCCFAALGRITTWLCQLVLAHLPWLFL